MQVLRHAETVFRIVLIAIVVVAVGGFVLGWWHGGDASSPQPGIVGTSGMAERPGGIEPATSEGILTDDALAVVIRSRMVTDEGVAAEGIQVRLSQGVVILSGTVRSRAEQQRAVQIARETEGVHDVRDELRILR